jgi:hypothetical protein
MLRAAVLAALIATAYCGAKGSPQPPAREVPDAGPATTPGPTPPPTSTAPSTSDAGSP